jgi:hypothetical protein
MMKLQVFVLAVIQLLLCSAQQEEATLQKRAREAYLFTNNGAMEHLRFNRRINVAEDRFLDGHEMSMSMSMSMPHPKSKKGKGSKEPKAPKEPKGEPKGMKGDMRRVRK